MTKPELALWLRLRALKAEGWHFRRQSPEGPYILDFVCRKAGIVVEVDGVHHATEQQTRHDRRRDEYLGRCGLRVLRFWASDIERECDSVVETIRNALGVAKGAVSSPRPRRQLRRTRRYQVLVRMGLRPKRD